MNNSGGFVVLIAIAVLLVLFWLSKTIGVPLDVIVDSGRNLVPVIVVGAIVVLWGMRSIGRSCWAGPCWR